MIYDVAANWKLIIHNYSECLHCPGVHPALQKLSHYLSGENEPARTSYLGGRMRLREGIGTLSFDGEMRRACLPGLGSDDLRSRLLLRGPAQPAAEPASRLRDGPHPLAARRRADRDRLRMVIPPRRARSGPTSTPTTPSSSGT